MTKTSSKINSVTKTLVSGGIGVMATDTLYGLVGKAILSDTVERIYRVKKRDPKKPMIILIASVDDLALFKVKFEEKFKELSMQFWPGEVSVILPCPHEEFFYLHRGTKTLAFRLVKKESLRALLQETGPLVAPTANPEGEEPAKTVEKAMEYFGDEIDFYMDDGKLDALPSTLITIEDNKIIVKRQGRIKI